MNRNAFKNLNFYSFLLTKNKNNKKKIGIERKGKEKKRKEKTTIYLQKTTGKKACENILKPR